MNKLFTKIAGVTLGFAMAIGVGVAVAGKQDVKAARAAISDPDDSVTFSNLYNANTVVDGTTIAAGDSTITFNKRSGGTATQYYTNGTSVRWYGGGTLVVASATKTIEAIDITYTRTDNSISASTGTWNSPSWTGSASSVTFTQSGTNGHLRVSTIDIKYSGGGGDTPVKGTLAITPVAENKLEIGAKGTFAYTLTGGTHTSLSTAVWGSDDTDVLTVNADTGAYEAVGAGNTTITLIGDDGDFDDYEATYDIQVVEPAPKYIDDTTNKTITWDLSVESYDSMTTEAAQWSSPKATVAVAKGSASTATNNYCPPANTSTRLYKNSSISFTPSSEYKITSIVAQATTSSYASALSGSTWTNATATSDSTTVTITPTVQKDAVSAVIGGTTGLTSIVVHYENASSSPLSSITLSGTYPTVFKQGDYFSHTGMIVTANYEDESSSDVTSSATWTGYDMTTAGEQEVTVSYTENEITKTAKYNITVRESIILSGENFSMAVGDDDVAPVIKIKDTSTVVEGCTLSTSNAAVASIVNNKVHAVGKGTATITAAHADEGNKTYTSATFTVTVAKVDTIQELYSKAKDYSVDVYGYYVGFLDGTGPVIMDGEYGIVIYNKTAAVSGYVEGETILHVTGSITIFNGLYEIGSSTIAVASGTYPAPAAPVVYTAQGGETAEYASRLTTVTGVGTVTKGNFDGDAGAVDITMNFAVGSSTVQVYYKKAAQTADTEAYAAIKTAVANQTEITVKGFTGWFNGFQVQMNGVVAAVDTYTAEDFSQDLLDQTDAICVNYVDGKSSYDEFKALLTVVWSDLASNDKYPSLPSEQKAILADAERVESGTVVEQAMARYDYLTGKYELNNFINGRTPMANFRGNLSMQENNDVATIVVIIAIASISAFGCLLILKKRKHQ